MHTFLKRITNFVGDMVEMSIRGGLPRNKSHEEWCRCFVSFMLDLERSGLDRIGITQIRDTDVREYVEKVGQQVLSQRGRERCQFAARATNQFQQCHLH